MQGFTIVDLIILVVYLAAVLFAGLHFAKKEMKGKERKEKERKERKKGKERKERKERREREKRRKERIETIRFPALGQVKVHELCFFLPLTLCG